MRIESVKLENFRQYRNAEFRFDRKQGQKDLHIIVGETGEGKSNLLNAITWCLYAEEMHLRDNDTALHTLNQEFVKELRNIGEQRGECKVTIVLSSDEDEISRLEICRTGVFTIKPESVRRIDDELNVVATINNVSTVADELDAKTYIQRYVPKDIINYIFFDGEQLEKYFGDDQQNVSRGIDALTQANIIYRAITKLEDYRNQELGKQIKNSGSEKVKECEERLEKLRKDIAINEHNVEEFDIQISTCEDEIARCNQIIHGNEWVPEKQRELQEIEEEEPKIKARLDTKKKEFMSYVRDIYHIFALYPALKEYYRYIIDKKKAGELPPAIDKSLIERSRDEHVCAVCHQPLNGKYYDDIVTLAERFMVASATSNVLSGSETAILDMFDKMRKYPATKENFIRDIQNIEGELRLNHTKYEEVYKYLKDIAGADQIVEALDRKERFEETKTELLMKKGAEVAILEQQRVRFKEADEELSKIISQNEKCKVLKNKKELCDKAIARLGEIRKEVLAQCRKDMQDETFRIFQSMHWKKDSFSGVKIKEDYKFQLFDKYGDQSLGSASAGETALLALAFTLALQDTSKHDSLLYIDTPIGRIGAKDRPEISRVLRDLAEQKQVILTFSPTEYDANVQATLADSTSTIVHLLMDDNHVTYIKEHINTNN